MLVSAPLSRLTRCFPGTIPSALVVLLLVACTPKEPPPPPPPVRPSAPALTKAEVAQRKEELAAVLTPVIRELGPEGMLPNKIVIELGRPVVSEEKLTSKVPAGTVLTIEPLVAGELRYEGPSTLAFVPEHSFLPRTSYAVSLLSVQTATGKVTPPAGQSWTQRFTTAPFQFVEATLGEVDMGSTATDKERRPPKLSVSLRYSGPVSAEQVQKLTTVLLDGVAVRSVTAATAEDRRVVELTALPPTIRPGGTVEVRVRGGVELAGNPKHSAPVATVKLTVRDPAGSKPLTILVAKHGESQTGHYIEIICNDDAAPGPTHYYYRDQLDRSLSARCQLDAESVRDKVKIVPAVKLTVASGHDGFRLLGDFRRGSYAVKILAGARTLDGGVLESTWSESLSIPARSPSLSYVSTGRYLPRSAWRSLPIKHINVDEVTLEIRKVPPENLLYWMTESSEAAGERTSDVILTKTIKLRGEPDVEKTTWIDVASLLPSNTKGVLQLKLTDAGKSSSQAVARLVLTSLNLVAKDTVDRNDKPGGVQVWALDMDTAAPQGGVEVKLMRPSGKVLARCITAGPAGCLLPPTHDPYDSAAPVALIAQRGDDLTYLKFSELRTETSETKSYGEPYEAEAPYRAVLYSDRGVYRPGETAHISGVVRDRKLLAPAANLPVTIEVNDPQANLYKRAALATNAAGLWSLDLVFAGEPSLGKYAVRALVGGKEVGSYEVQCEEFVPERMKVTAAAQRSHYLEGERAAIDVTAQYLFGSDAAGNKAELTCELVAHEFKPTENDTYHYGVWRSAEARPLTLGSDSGELDEHGQRTLTCPEPPADKTRFSGTAELRANVTVAEGESGRTTVTHTTVQIHPERYYLGLLTSKTTARVGETIPVTGVVVDWQGKLVTSVKEVDIEFLDVEEDYGWYYEDVSGDSEWKRFRHPNSVGKTQVAVTGGHFSLQFRPKQDASAYLVRATAGKARTDLSLEGSADYGWRWRYYESSSSAETDVTPRPQRATALQIEGPERVQVGVPAQVVIKAPYRGQVLVTLESDQLLSSEWLTVGKEGEIKWSFTVREFLPNVYVSAFLVKDPHLQSAQSYMPDRAFGLLSVPVDPAQYALTVKLDTPKEVRSKSTLAVKLDLGPQSGPTFVTVAAVDAGILSLTGFQPPDPLHNFLLRRKLGVDTYETVGWTMLMPPMGSSSLTGGGDEGGGSNGPGTRPSPVKPVALWSGIVEVPASGQLTVPLSVPTYRGELRVMVVAASKERIGHASASVLVRDPLTLQTTVPRFLLAGDELTIPVMISNLSGAERAVTVAIAAEARPIPGLALADSQPLGTPLGFIGPTKSVLKLKNGQTGTVRMSAKVLQALGSVKLTVTARAGNLESNEELEIPLLPAGPHERIVQRLEVKPGELDLMPYLKGWVPGSERSTFWLTNNPYADVFDHLAYLVHYPYGCIEQTTSSTRPLLYLPELVASIDPTLLADKKIEDMVLAGIRRVFSMQTPSGGFAFWPGDTSAYPWGTAYATHMLLDAKKLGYAVPQPRLDDVMRYIEDELTHKYETGHTDSYSHYSSGSDEVYLQYVLALAGRGRKARLQQLLDALIANKSPGHDRPEQLYMIKAALYLAGDRRYERDLKSPDVSAITDDRWNNWSLYSDRRARGLMLSIFSDLFGAAPEGEPLADLVAQMLRGHRSYYYTTQELVWGITGLGKRLGKLATEVGTPTLLANTQKRTAQSRGSGYTWALARASEYKSLLMKVPAPKSGKLYLVVSSAGVRTTPTLTSGGEGLTLDRTYRDSTGSHIKEPTKPNEISGALGDLIYVELEITNKTGDHIANIALVDPLPAGWEIENPRLGREHAADWLRERESSLWAVDHMNLRDDRLEAFGSIEAGETKHLIYALRAVTTGKYTLPAASAEAMYDPRLWARTVSERVTVTGPAAAEAPSGAPK